MYITVINGTEHRGCTYRMKEIFLHSLGGNNTIKEYYLPKDAPVFCTGCKACFYKNISVCPHAAYTQPIWQDILAADLLVFASPVYAWHTTGQMKALLDHYCTKWMAHSPETPMFSKQAVIITNAAGAGMKGAVKDIGDSLTFWGIGRKYIIKQALFYADWTLVSNKNKKRIDKQCGRVSYVINQRVGHVTPSIKTKFLFTVMGFAHKMINRSLLKANQPETADYRYWQEQGWLNGGKPWKK